MNRGCRYKKEGSQYAFIMFTTICPGNRSGPGRHRYRRAAVALTSDLNSLQEQVERFEPNSFGGLLRFLEEGRRHYRLALDRFVSRNFLHAWDYFNPLDLKLIWDLKPMVRHYTNIGHYF